MLIDKAIKPLFKLESDKARHFLKAISWRAVGTIDTMCVAWFVSGSPLTGLKIGATEVFTKIFLYYFHERLWFKVNFGIQRPRKIESEINWEPDPESWTQVAFIQSEKGKIRKRAKILTDGRGDYRAILSSYNSDTKARFNDILSGTKETIENNLNIKL